MADILVKAARLATVASCRAVLSLRSQGLPPTTGRPRIYAANHISHADFVALWTALPPAMRATTRPVAGADYWQASAFRKWVISQVFHGVLVDRGGKRRPAAEDEAGVMERLAQPLSQGEDLILFPEGTRNLTGSGLLRLRSGIYQLMLAVPGTEVVPAWISHMDRILPKGGLVPVPLNCTLQFGPPLQLEEGEKRLDFLARLHSAILACKEVKR